jgi:hypothetical protein
MPLTSFLDWVALNPLPALVGLAIILTILTWMLRSS